MYINSTSWKPMSTHRNSLKLDILQLIRMCRERSGNNSERIEDIINRSQKKLYRKVRNPSKIISESLKTQEPKRQLPKLTNKSTTKINRKDFKGKERQGDSKELQTPKKKIIRPLHKYKLSTEKPEAVVFEIDKLSYAGSLPHQHFSKKKRLHTQLPPNCQAHLGSNPELRTLIPLPIIPLVSPSINPSSTILRSERMELPANEPQSIEDVYPSTLVQSASRQLHKEFANKINKQKKEMNLFTNNGWKVEFNQYESLYN